MLTGMLGILTCIVYFYYLLPTVAPYKIVRDSCPVCPPCAVRPPAFMQKRTRISFESSLPRAYEFSTEDENEEPFRLAVMKDNQEGSSHKTIDLSKYEVKLISSHSVDINTKKESTTSAPLSSTTTTTKRIPSTIPTATPFAPRVTRFPFFSKEKHSEKTKKIKVSEPQVTTPTPDNFGRKTIASMMNGLNEIEHNNAVTTTDTSATENSPFGETAALSSIPDDIPLSPAGYQTNPMFNADEVHIEDEKCNDKDLQRILVEGLRVDDSIGSKRSIGAILTASKITTASVLCSDQEMAFRLVARRHCQLSAGKTTCVLFVL